MIRLTPEREADIRLMEQENLETDGSERTVLLAEIDALRMERDAAREERDARTAALDKIAARNHDMIVERAALIEQGTALMRERDEAQAEIVETAEIIDKVMENIDPLREILTLWGEPIFGDPVNRAAKIQVAVTLALESLAAVTAERDALHAALREASNA